VRYQGIRPAGGKWIRQGSNYDWRLLPSP
jgi:hypothetical protein